MLVVKDSSEMQVRRYCQVRDYLCYVYEPWGDGFVKVTYLHRGHRGRNWSKTMSEKEARSLWVRNAKLGYERW